MRVIGGGNIWNTWNAGGPAVGSNKPHGRVTVEIDWFLTESAATVGTYTRGPIRWWQRADDSQVETEVPNIEAIEIDRSIDQDAQTCTIKLSNQWHYVNGEIALNDGELGQPGFFTWSRGESQESQDRWGHLVNEWNDVIIPDALLRTYQGYGGHHKTLDDAVGDGNLVLSGVWLIDEVRIDTNGKIEIRCRDMAKLVVEQQMYPPLVPFDSDPEDSLYPLKYCRWGYHDLGSTSTLITVGSPDVIPGPQAGPVLISATTNYAGLVPEPAYTDYEGNEPGNGYWLLDTDGNVWAFGNNVNYGNATSSADWSTNPAIKIEPTITGRGYWVLMNNGTVRAFGDAPHYGNAPSSTNGMASMCSTYKGDGYWVVARDGSVHAFGAATGFGNAPANVSLGFPLYTVIVDIAMDPRGMGYWTLDNEGSVSAFGTAISYGEPQGATFPGSGTIRTHGRIQAHPNGLGYWTIDQVGDVYAFGSAEDFGQLAGQAYVALGGNLPFNNPNFPDYMCDVVPTPSGNGYWLVGTSGGVYPFGDAIALGGANGPYEAWLRTDGNYRDYTDIVKELLLWAGFWLYEPSVTGTPQVFGNLETTGAFASDCLPDEMLDKQPVIDPITKLKEIVGYLFYVDEDGAVHFESPNVYSMGNFVEFGVHVDDIPEIDEAIQLTQYSVSYSDKSARSEIIISTTDPTTALDDTVTTRITPSTSEILRGMVKPAMWVNGVFTTKNEQEIMAELIALYSWLAQRQGAISCMANPCIQINDQVRIFERQTSESYIHYIRGISSSMDLITGDYSMTLTTHWMGDETLWAVDLGVVPYDFQDIVTWTPQPLVYSGSTSNIVGAPADPDITLDGNLATFWTVPGNTGQILNTAVEYIEYTSDEGPINRVGIYPFGAGRVYVSVMDSGVWQGASTVPYNPIRSPGLYTGANTPVINYVLTTTLNDDEPVVLTLPATYDIQRLRLTFTDFGASNWGPQYYIGGLREVAVGLA